MNKKCLLSILTLCMTVGLVSCNSTTSSSKTETSSSSSSDSMIMSSSPISSSEIISSSSSTSEMVDYVKECKFVPSADRAYSEVTVYNYVDGDTTHFNAPNIAAVNGGILKVRYLGIDTPESTSKIEPWGKTASNFTHDKLANAESIIVESETKTWNPDSTGSRYLAWVWYKTKGTTEYRLLNLELMQEGLSAAKGYSTTTYGEYFGNAFIQARSLQLHLWGNEKEPGFPDGNRINVTLKELRINPTSYQSETGLGVKVRFEGVVTKCFERSFYIEDLDAESGKKYGFYCFSQSNKYAIATPGNRISVAGRLEYYATAGTYQISDLAYFAMRPNNEDSMRLITQGEGVYDPSVVTYNDIYGKESIIINQINQDTNEEEEVSKEFDSGFLRESTLVTMKNLKVESVYTTNNEGSSSNGAMTLTCKDALNNTLKIRTIVLTKNVTDPTTGITDTILVKEDEYKGKTIDVVGIIDEFSGEYQIKVLSYNDITIVE